jgi:sporulation protein YlmC with PRC-barrel domain
MRKCQFTALLTIVLLLLAGGTFAKQNAGQGAAGPVANVPEGGHINAFRVDNITGSTVINLEGENIGTINNLVIDIDTGDIVYAVLEFGGFMDFGDKLFAVPWQSLTAVPAEGIFILDQSRARLAKAPGFDKNKWPDIGDRSWRAGIYAFYRQHAPYHRIPAAPPAPPKQEMQHGYRGGYLNYPVGGYPGIWGDPFGGMFNPKTMDTVSGEILKIEYHDEMTLLVYTDAKKPVLVALGPTGYFISQVRTLQPGDKITVTGSKVIVDDTPYVIATKIKEGNEELHVRDKEGHPIWMAWKKIK